MTSDEVARLRAEIERLRTAERGLRWALAEATAERDVLRRRVEGMGGETRAAVLAERQACADSACGYCADRLVDWRAEQEGSEGR